jgi:streptomycin 6-kinase
MIPARLQAACARRSKYASWLASLPATVSELEKRWSLEIGEPFEIASAGWVAPVKRADGTSAVLKISMPHSECEHEIDGMRFWDGQASVRLLDSDRELRALLLEHCAPGTGLWKQPTAEQDQVLAGILKRLRRMPAEPHPFRDLRVMLTRWDERTRSEEAHWGDGGLVREGLRLFAELSATSPCTVLLSTDLHAGNVLAAERELWLAIDPRPYAGDPAYDATQHLINRIKPRADAVDVIRRFAELAELDWERVRLWTFARAAAQPRDDWSKDPLRELAQAIAP